MEGFTTASDPSLTNHHFMLMLYDGHVLFFSVAADKATITPHMSPISELALSVASHQRFLEAGSALGASGGS